MPRRAIVPALSLVLSVTFFAAPPSRAQSAVAVDAGLATLSCECQSVPLVETGVRFSSLQPKRLNVDVRIATLPQTLGWGVVLLPDIDATFVVPLGKRALLTPRAGFSMILAASGEGAAFVPGVNYGLGLVAPVNESVALRFDWGRRTYGIPGEEGQSGAGGLSSFLIGIAWTH